MAELSVNDDRLQLKLSRWERLGSLRRDDLVFALANVARVERLENARTAIRGLRAPGTGWPGRIALGSWRTRRTVDFVAVYGNKPGYMFELEGERFARLVVSSPRIPEVDALL